ncbi:TFIIE alpha subunit-domain-containing protein [Flagelloscypha sp. PMI_526]|nr:TFIIE alpha subunit-domain-containing protein [Flagelloscypha sp. PMI_526]
MTTTEDQDALRLLVQHVSRAFYEPKYVIILDQLARHAVLKDEDLAGRMGLQPKELNKIITVLMNDRLVEVWKQNELKEGAQRVVGRQYYYINYESFCNVVKWRISAMFRAIDTKLRNEIDNKGYVCPRCKAQYAPLDVGRLFDFSRNCAICEICGSELIDNEEADNGAGNNDRMQRFNHQIRFIREGLQKSEGMVIPHFDARAWVIRHSGQANRQAENSPGGDLKIAGSDPNSKAEDQGVGVVISTDMDEATRRQQRYAEAEAKRAQNALPAWHLKSTISGDLTALGVKENARLAAAAATDGLAQLHQSMSDDALKGLGVIGSSSKASSSTQLYAMPAQEEDVKPMINHEADYYDQYYASLHASAQATPASSTPRQPDASSDFEDDDEDEGSSFNASGKRSRDDGVQSGRIKTPRLDGDQFGISESASWSSGTSLATDPPTSDPSLSQLSQGDPHVSVNGKLIRFSEVTDDHHEQMTEEEYTAFFELMSAREG